jgi:hypothetical protein
MPAPVSTTTRSAASVQERTDSISISFECMGFSIDTRKIELTE